MNVAQPGLAALHQLIRQHCGLRFEGEDEPRLRQAVNERAFECALDLPGYLLWVERSADELQALVNLLTINETYFFREPEQIALITERILPRLLAGKGGADKVRVLSAGCSSGEEPYSLAMALLDNYGAAFVREHFVLLGGDLDSDALAQARRAQYSNFSFRGVAAATRSRHFEACERGWQLKTEVRQLVSFHPLNLLAPNPAAVFHGCDLILFRNVSIYFDTEARRRIQHQLAGLLRDDGFLLVGSAETLANDLGVLELVEESGHFYFIKGQPPLAGASIMPASALSGWRAPPRRSQPALVRPPAPLVVPAEWTRDAPALSAQEEADELERARRLVREQQFAPALRILDSLLEERADNAAAMLLKAYLLLERKEFAAAEALAQASIALDDWSLDAYVLLGLNAKWAGKEEQAIRHFRQAAYIEHDCWPAHYFLADLWRGQGKWPQARRAWRVVLQLLNGAGDSHLSVLPLELPVAQIRFMCERQLAQAAASDCEG